MLFVNLPLYPQQDYFYSVVLDEVACVIRIYYNQRADGWFFDLREEGGDYFLRGARLVPDYPMISGYPQIPLSGFLWLEPIGDSGSKYYTDAFHLSKYFRLFYIPEQPSAEV